MYSQGKMEEHRVNQKRLQMARNELLQRSLWHESTAQGEMVTEERRADEEKIHKTTGTRQRSYAGEENRETRAEPEGIEEEVQLQRQDKIKAF